MITTTTHHRTTTTTIIRRPTTRRGRPRGGATVVEIDVARLRRLVDEQLDATIRELHERLAIDRGYTLQME